MKLFGKIISTLLITCIMLSILPMSAFAAETEVVTETGIVAPEEEVTADAEPVIVPEYEEATDSEAAIAPEYEEATDSEPAIVPEEELSAYEADDTMSVGIEPMSAFSPRTTAPNFNSFNSGNPFPYNSGNCTWYAWARIREIYGVNIPFRGNANSWFPEAPGRGFARGSEARVGAIAAWGGTFGHVAVVERIENGIVYISESNWGGPAFRFQRLNTAPWNGHVNGLGWVTLHFQGFIYVGDPPPPRVLTPGVYQITTATLNVRTGVGTSHPVFGTVHNGNRVSVTEISSGWGRINHNGRVGWISLNYAVRVGNLEILHPPGIPASASIAGYGTPAVNGLNIGIGDRVRVTHSAVSGATGFRVDLIHTTNSAHNRSNVGTNFIINQPGIYRVDVRAVNSAGQSGPRASNTITVHPNPTVTFFDEDGVTVVDRRSVGQYSKGNKPAHNSNRLVAGRQQSYLYSS